MTRAVHRARRTRTARVRRTAAACAALAGVAALLAAGASPRPAPAHFIGADSVDGREVRFIESSKYDKPIKRGMATWNDLGRVKIEQSGNSPTLQIVDFTNPFSGVRGSWQERSGPDLISFNTAEMDSGQGCGDSVKRSQQNTAIHEFGHALGLDHSFEGNIMYAFCSQRTKLGKHDKQDYRELWGGGNNSLRDLSADGHASHVQLAFDPEDPEQAAEFASHVFVARIEGDSGDKAQPTSDPDVKLEQRQFRASVIHVIKGKLKKDRVEVNLPLLGDDEEADEPPQLGAIYLLLTRRDRDNDWYTIVAPQSAHLPAPAGPLSEVVEPYLEAVRD